MTAPDERCIHELVKAQCADCRRRTVPVRFGQGGPIIGSGTVTGQREDGALELSIEITDPNAAAVVRGPIHPFVDPSPSPLTWIEARFPGRCAECGDWFDAGDEIARWPAGAFGWIARCCE